jgi:DNA-binding HxlR family transcriptional regulator
MADAKAERSKQRDPLSSLKWASREERTRSEYLACPIRQVVSRFGDKWSLLVLFLLNRSDTGVLRFNEMRRFMTDCSQKMLSQTLKNLEQSHLVHREVFPEVPPRVEYSLTDTGKSLMPALTALIDWGKEHFDEVVTDDLT